MSLQIHWHEGLFLQPQHLQRFQKNVFALADQLRLGSCPYPYGVVEARLSYDKLENKLISFDRLRAIMPSGLEVDFPRNAELPVIDIKQAFQAQPGGFRISLGVPLWHEKRANTLDETRTTDVRGKYIYRLAETSFADENTGEAPKDVLVRRLNARLLLDHEDPSDLEVLPLLRIVRSSNDESSLPRQDPDFVGPCVVINGSPTLRELVRDLAAQVEASRKELVVQITRSGFSLETLRGRQFEQLMRLRSLNRFAGRLPSLVEAPGITPFAWYLELRDLLGELVALFPDRDDFEVPNYLHDNPVLVFRELALRIRSYLRGAVAPSFLKIPFKPNGKGELVAALTPEHFTKPTDYLLGIRTREDPRALAAFVENDDVFKLMPESALVRAFFGIPLKEERHPPLELPAAADLHYFRLDRVSDKGQRYWSRIEQEKVAGIKWTGKENVDYDIALYLVVPPQ